MKYHGNDLFTQEEFDKFRETNFDPLVKKVGTLSRWVTGLSFGIVFLVSADVLIFFR
jgi:hypothetical protein